MTDSRTMPNAVDVERSLLGAVMMDNDLIHDALAKLRPDDFYLEAHRRVYEMMVELSENGRPIDAMTVADKLLRAHVLDAVGGLAFVSGLSDGVPRSSSIEYYVQIVKNKATLRNLIRATAEIEARAYDQSEKAADVVDSAQAALQAISEDAISGDLRPLGAIITDEWGEIDAMLSSGASAGGIRTGLTDLDNLVGGFRQQELVILAARPSMGKTMLGMNIAFRAALDRKKVAVFSQEMSSRSIIMRLVSSEAQIDNNRVQNGHIGSDEVKRYRDAVNAMVASGLYIDDTAAQTVSQIRAKSRRMQLRKGLDMIVIDYLQLMRGEGRSDNRNHEVQGISDGLKALAKGLNVPVIALSQLSRASESGSIREPRMSDLRDSGAIEQAADVAMFIHRPNYYDHSNVEWEGKSKIIVGKNRNGVVGELQLLYRPEYQRFDTLARESWAADEKSSKKTKFGED